MSQRCGRDRLLLFGDGMGGGVKLKAVYVGLTLAALVLLVVFGSYRRSSEAAPWWLYLILAVVAPLGIWVDIVNRRRKRHGR